jgi:RHS repeat-associated protein
MRLHAGASAGQNGPLEKIFIKAGGIDFIDAPQTRTAPSANAHVYDRTVSGACVYNHFRNYDPTLGRYVQSDPMGLRGNQLSTYTYVGSDPVIVSDIDGLVIGLPNGWQGSGPFSPPAPPGWSIQDPTGMGNIVARVRLMELDGLDTFPQKTASTRHV